MTTNFRTAANTAERIGLAMAGMACGIFVAAAVSHASSPLLASIWTTLAIIAAGGAGFSVAIAADLGERRPRTDWMGLLRPAGTLLASAVALTAVMLLVFDSQVGTLALDVLTAGWIGGTALQVAASLLARRRPHPLRRRLVPGAVGSNA